VALARRASGFAGEEAALAMESIGICWGGGGLGDGTGRSRHGKKIATKEAAGCRLGVGNRRESFLSAREVQCRRAMPRCAAEYARVKMRVREGGNAKLLKMPTLFPKLLETKFSCFAKFSRMPTSFSKLLEMLLDLYL